MTCQGPEKEWMCKKDDDGWWQDRGLDKIITSYVRNQIRGRHYNDRQLINELMDIEMYCVRGARSSGDAMNFAVLRKKHPFAYLEIRTELDPEWESHKDASLAEWDRKLDQDVEMRARAEDEKRLRAEQDRKIWQELGGKGQMHWAQAMAEFNAGKSEDERRR